MNLPAAYPGGEQAPVDRVAAPSPVAISDRLNFRDIVAIFNRRIKLFAIVAFVIFELAQLITWRMTNYYSATAEIALIRSPDQVAPKGSNVVDDDQTTTDVDNEVQVLTSRELAGKVADTLSLAADKTFVSLRPGADPKTAPSLRQLAIDKLVFNLDVERVKTAFVLTLNYQDSDPVRSAQIVNMFAHLYAAQQIDGKRQANARATAFLAGQIEKLRGQAQDNMRALQDYRVRNNLLSTSGSTLTEQEISTYNQQAAQSRAQAIEDAAKLANAKRQLLHGANGSDIGQSLASPVIQGLRQQRAILSGKVADLSSHYGDRYPDLVDARSQLRDIDLQIQTEVFRELSSLDAQSRVSAQRLASIQSSLGGARNALAQNNQAMVTLDDLTRRATTSQELYQSYMDRYKAVAAQSGNEAANARVLSDATVPTAPSSPHVLLNLLLGLFLGVGLGTAAAIAAELYFTGFTTGDEIEQRLGLPYLGGVPALQSIAPREATPLKTVESFPRSAFAESFRSVLASVRHARSSRHGVVAVTSALPGEGKSTLAVCLAAASSIGGSERVVAIDLDVSQHRLSKLMVTDPTRPGLREVLLEGAAVDDALIQVDGSNLYILPITNLFEKTEQLTRGGLVHALVARLREFFPLIILDCPPLLPVAEARDLVALADDVILVAAWRKTKESALRSAIRMLPAASVAKTGIVLTRIDMKKQARFGAGDATSFYKKYRHYYAS